MAVGFLRRMAIRERSCDKEKGNQDKGIGDGEDQPRSGDDGRVHVGYEAGDGGETEDPQRKPGADERGIEPEIQVGPALARRIPADYAT